MTKKLSSKVLYEFYKELEKYDIENHGLLIMQGHETIYEEYAYPYSADMPHTLFSVTKSLVSTAIGFAIDEGLFSLDSKILPFFSEYKHPESDEWDNMTVRSLLTMNSNKEFSFLQDMTADYTAIFMKSPFRKSKGFLYSNNDVHILSALVHKLSGESVVDYLDTRLFKPLGIDKPFWETNEKGECIGGTGAYLKLRDLAKICRCYADGGVYEGKQIIPEFWTREATKKQVTFDNPENGYGYLFWINGDMYSMTGMFGQIISYVPKYDAVVAIMNCCIKEGENERLLKEKLLTAFEEDSDETWDEKLREYLDARGEKPLPCNGLPKIPVGKEFYLKKSSDINAKLFFPASIIPRTITCSLAKRPKNNIDKVSFDLTDEALVVNWYEEEDKVTIRFGLKGEACISECSIKGYPYKMWAYAYMDRGVIEGVVKPINTLSTQYISIRFSGNELYMSMKGTPNFTEFIGRHTEGLDFFRLYPKMSAPLLKGFYKVISTVDKEMIFKAK